VKNRSLIRQFGLEIKRRRTEMGITQEEFADRSGLHRTYISGIERGGRNPTIDIVFEIARALACDPADIMPSTVDEK
jgi:transcriptional regulator with XRE-family HTH domain